jgi:hypothetical protein
MFSYTAIPPPNNAAAPMQKSIAIKMNGFTVDAR